MHYHHHHHHVMKCRLLMIPGVCHSVCHATSLCKTAERIEVLLRVKTPEGPRHSVLDGEGRGFDVAFAKLLWLFGTCLRLDKLMHAHFDKLRLK